MQRRQQRERRKLQDAAVRSQPSLTYLGGKWSRIARLAWVLLLLLTAGKMALGLPRHYEETRSVCTAADDVCSRGDSLTPGEVEALEAAGLTLDTYANAELAWRIGTSAIWAGISLFIFLLRPNDWLAWIASAMMLVFNSAGYEAQIRTAYPSLGTIATLHFSLGNILLFLFIGLFPSGRFSPRWMRWYWLGMIVLSLADGVIWNQGPEIVIVIFWVSFLILGPTSQIYRYRNESTAVERQQTKWVVLGFAVFAGAVLVGFMLLGLRPDIGLGQIIYQTFAFDFAGLFIPLSIGLSILRYRLWDIDVIIRRTLTYTLLTSLLILAYFGGVVILQGIFSALTGKASTPLVTVISTLGIAALFVPVRSRAQAFVDRRFYRVKYNSEQALARFGMMARREVDLERLVAGLLGVIEETVQPERTILWLRPTATRRNITTGARFPSIRSE